MHLGRTGRSELPESGGGTEYFSPQGRNLWDDRRPERRHEAEEQAEPLTTEQILFIHANKTAALIQSAMTIGATLAGATDEEIAALELCAYNVGIAFQIQDDILDVIGDSKELGKATGSDAQNHKQTYVTLHGLEESGREVERLTGEAVAILDSFSGEHEFLKELLLHLVHRTK